MLGPGKLKVWLMKFKTEYTYTTKSDRIGIGEFEFEVEDALETQDLTQIIGGVVDGMEEIEETAVVNFKLHIKKIGYGNF